MTKIVENRDNPDILVTDDAALAYVEEVHGPGAEEIPDFVPTRQELVQLLEFWAKVHFGEHCSYRTRDLLVCFSRRRLHRIANLLETEEVRKIVYEVHREFMEKGLQQLNKILPVGRSTFSSEAEKK